MQAVMDEINNVNDDQRFVMVGDKLQRLLAILGEAHQRIKIIRDLQTELDSHSYGVSK